MDEIAYFDNSSFFAGGGSLYLSTENSGAGSIFNITLGGWDSTGPTSGRGVELRSATAGTSTLTFEVSSGNASMLIKNTGGENSGVTFEVDVALASSLDVMVHRIYSGSLDGVNFRQLVTGTGGINKTGKGLVRFDGTAGVNTFSGGLSVSDGIVYASKDGALGTGDVTIAQSAVDTTAALEITTGITDAIFDTSNLYLGSFGGNFSTITLAGGVSETIGGLFFDGLAQSTGTWGSTSSGATYQNDDWFAGTGVLNVVPEPSAFGLLLGIAAFGALYIRRRR